MDTEEVEENTYSPMKNYFNGKTVFLTGGTGFLGQLFTEKLLRAGVEKIYMLARPNKGKTAEERLKEIFVGMQFCKLLKYDKDFIKRLHLIDGDFGKIAIGISESNQKLLIENVDIVLHAAANVKFDEKLCKILLENLRGTRELLKLAERMKKLQVLAYISTAFSNCPRFRVDEKFYECPIDPDTMIAFAERYNKDEKNIDLVDILTERIVHPWPNTYTYTKALSEGLVRRYGEKYPICIIRPSIVISTFEDPIPAWCNNIYGLNGVLIAVGMGVLRLLPLRNTAIGTIVCADFVINSTLAAIWVTHLDTNTKELSTLSTDSKIYNVCTSSDKPTRWSEIAKGMLNIATENPHKKMFWKPCSNSVVCPFMWRYLTIFYHVIPAIVTDICMILQGKRLRVLPIYRKVQRFMEALKHFMKNEWIFTTKNMRQVVDRMSPYDKDFFPADVTRWNWSTFKYNYFQGLRVYIGQDDLNASPVANLQFKFYSILHFLVLILYYCFHIFIFIFIANELGIFDYFQEVVRNTYAFLLNPQNLHPDEVHQH